jgi:GNAT superfamily N-acetyltransferase
MATAAKKWNVRFAGTEAELERCYLAMVELRPHLSCGEFVKAVRRQDEQDGYRLVYVEDEDEVMGVAGFRILQMLVTGRVLYVDDLVIVEERRSRGYGAHLFNWLVHYATAQECKTLELDSGVQRTAAHRFYFRQRMHISSYHFRLKVND